MTPTILEFQYRQGQDTLHWFGLLTSQRLFLDSAELMEQADHKGLAAILEFVEMKMDAISVLLGVSRGQTEGRGHLLRAFRYAGFEVVRPEQQRWLPTCADNVFLVYTMDRVTSAGGIKAPTNNKP
ncbi:ornithine decarboxylase antizyme 3-like [Bufo gargarizans]|uniref:ornithine decarboxylase antizyme 3-like n=1 Tax=Bufo gargarizans TaxID=30331 RepID=UPI001CF10391|nr:ornithine decarboxylase antizyme 3-like [Bufo gargarizans]